MGGIIVPQPNDLTQPIRRTSAAGTWPEFGYNNRVWQCSPEVIVAGQQQRVTTVMGVDPGSVVTGVAILQGKGTRKRLIEARALRLKGSMAQRLVALYAGMEDLLKQYPPDEVAVEKVFTARNPGSALKLGQARGVILLALLQRDLPVYEYAATRVKSTTTGHGHAGKEDMQRLIQMEFGLKKPLQADANDAVAIALTHLTLRQIPEAVLEARL